MSKSILVIDTPKCCEECSLGIGVKREGGAIICGGSENINSDSKKKPDWCPLKKYHKTSVGIESCIGNKTECIQSYVDGYNACIDEIIKNMPIAYDVNKVVKRLEDESFECLIENASYVGKSELKIVIEADKAIEIVKEGVIGHES